MNVTISTIDKACLPELFKLYQNLCSEGTFYSSVQNIPFEKFEEWFLSNLAHRYPQSVAHIERNVVGWAQILPKGAHSFNHVGVLWMGIDPGKRRMGIGSSLLGTALKNSQASGFEKIELEVFGSNIAAIKLYEKFHFQVEGIRKKTRKTGDYYDDIIMMCRFL